MDFPDTVTDDILSYLMKEELIERPDSGNDEMAKMDFYKNAF